MKNVAISPHTDVLILLTETFFDILNAAKYRVLLEELNDLLPL